MRILGVIRPRYAPDLPGTDQRTEPEPSCVEVLLVMDRPLTPTAFGVCDDGREVAVPVGPELARDLRTALAEGQRPVIVVEGPLYPFGRARFPSFVDRVYAHAAED